VPIVGSDDDTGNYDARHVHPPTEDESAEDEALMSTLVSMGEDARSCAATDPHKPLPSNGSSDSARPKPYRPRQLVAADAEELALLADF